MSKDGSERSSAIERRNYLQGLLAAGGASVFGLSGAAGTASAAANDHAAIDLATRLSRAQSKENEARLALTEPESRNGDQPLPQNTSRPPKTTSSGEVYNKYQKALQADSSWKLPQSTYDTLTSELSSDPQSGNRYVDVPLGGDRELVEPMAAWHHSGTGIDSWMTTMPEPPEWGGDRMAAEMAMNYWMAYFRDEPLENLESAVSGTQFSTTISNIQNNVSEELGWDTTSTPFRSTWNEVNDGPYLTQFYTHPIEFGNLTFEPTVRTLDGGDYNVSGSDVEEVMTGASEHGAEPFGRPHDQSDEGSPRWITTPRDLASLVRNEPSYQHYLTAALQLLEWGAEPNPRLPLINTDESHSSLPYIKYGGAGLLDLIARAAGNALDAAWYHKWLVHLRPRPEKYGAALQEASTPSDHAPTWAINDPSFNVTGNRYLSQAYPEGAPAHPAYPSGHSAIAGACATVLKIMFDDNMNFSELNNYPGHMVNQSGSPTSYSGQYDPTIAGEINKLADNVGVARIWAGVHYWSDHYYGMRLGEQAGLATILDVTMTEYGGGLDTSDFRTDLYSSHSGGGGGILSQFGSGGRAGHFYGLDTLRELNQTRDKVTT